MKSVGYISRWRFCRYVLTWWLVCWMLLGIPVQIAMANPSPVPGTAPSSGNVIDSTVPLGWTGDGGSNPIIGTPTGNNIVTWNNFDIGSGGASVTFTQDGGWILNNVQAADMMATGINGQLLGPDCGIIVVNPLGIVFGPQALVSAKNFVGSSLNISDDDFINGNLNFTGGGLAGDVINNGVIVAEEMAALIGRNVINRGIIRAPDGYAIMAAGDSVLISGNPGNSNVVVEVAMANPDEHLVDHRHDGVGPPTDIDADHVILAAGDIFSTAIEGVETLRAEALRNAVFTGPISAYAESDSDAVADVTIITGGNLAVNNEITAEAKANGDEDSAIATVTIDAGGDLVINERVKAKAEAFGGAGDATAGVDIDAGGSVYVQDKVEAESYAGHGSGDATSQVTVDAGSLHVSGEDGKLTADAYTEHGSGDADADVGITLLENLTVTENGKIEAFAETYHYGSGNATSDIEIDAGGSVLVSDADSEGNPKIFARSITDYPKWVDSVGDATATVDIDAAGDVVVTEDGEVKAEAWIYSNGGETKAEDQFVFIGTSYIIDTRDATADVTITADGDVIVAKGAEVKARASIETGLDDCVECTQVALEENGDEEVLVVPGDAMASVAIDAGGDVSVSDGLVKAKADIYNGGMFEPIRLAAENGEVPDSGDATASVDIDAGGNVIVNKGGEVYAVAKIYNEAQLLFLPSPGALDNGLIGPPALGDATASVDIDAGGHVTVIDGDVGAEAKIENVARYIRPPRLGDGVFVGIGDLGDATANVHIGAGGNVTVGGGECEGGEIYAVAEIDNIVESPFVDALVASENGDSDLPKLGDATAGVDIDAGGLLTVDEGGGVYAEASIEYYYGQFENGASLLLEPIPELDSGDATASIDIDAYWGVIVEDGGEVVADAWIQNFGLVLPDVSVPVLPMIPGDASASVDIQTCGDVIVNDLIGAYASIDPFTMQRQGPRPPSNTDASVAIRAAGDVIVNQLPDLPVPAGDGQEIALPINGIGSNGRIDAIASGGSQANSGDITILACSDVIVNDGAGRTPIYEEMRAAAQGGYTNSSHLGIATLEGDVIISGQVHAHSASAIGEGSENISNIEICAGRDLTVTGGTKYIFNGTATVAPFDQGGQIMADSHNGFFNTANVDIYAGRDVTVEGADVVYVGPLPKDDIGSYGGQIVATAQNGFENTADIGIYAQRDVTIGGPDVIGPGPIVDVAINGGGYEGQVLAVALNGGTNSAEVDICAQDDVTVDGTVRAVAEGGCEDSADVTIAAGSLIDGIGYISAQADLASILLYATDLDNILIGITPAHFNIRPEIEIGDVDCPECDFEWIDWSWCEECEEEVPAALAAPLYVQELPEIEGCPVLMEAVALELGIPVETLQVYIANALATNPNIQPCEMCARLVNSAAVLRDAGGIAALAQVVNEFVTTPAPPSEEQMTSIATAFAEHTADRTYYAAGGQWIDALDQYISVLTAEMYYSTGEAAAFADQYIAPVRDMGNESLTGFVEARLAALGG